MKMLTDEELQKIKAEEFAKGCMAAMDLLIKFISESKEDFKKVLGSTLHAASFDKTMEKI